MMKINYNLNPILHYLTNFKQMNNYIQFEIKKNFLKTSKYHSVIISLYNDDDCYYIRGLIEKKELYYTPYSYAMKYDNSITGINKLIEIINEIKNDKINYKLNIIEKDFTDQ